MPLRLSGQSAAERGRAPAGLVELELELEPRRKPALLEPHQAVINERKTYHVPTLRTLTRTVGMELRKSDFETVELRN